MGPPCSLAWKHDAFLRVMTRWPGLRYPERASSSRFIKHSAETPRAARTAASLAALVSTDLGLTSVAALSRCARLLQIEPLQANSCDEGDVDVLQRTLVQASGGTAASIRLVSKSWTRSRK